MGSERRARVVALGIAVVCGVAVGVFGGAIYEGRRLESMEQAVRTFSQEMLAMQHLAFEGEEAFEPYRDGNNHAALYAFTHYIKIIEYYERQMTGTDTSLARAVTWDKAVAMFRLGAIRGRMGDAKAASRLYKEAVHAAKKYRPDMTVERLRSFVMEADTVGRSQARTTREPWLVPGMLRTE